MIDSIEVGKLLTEFLGKIKKYKEETHQLDEIKTIEDLDKINKFYTLMRKFLI